jgi:hypothetical protein
MNQNNLLNAASFSPRVIESPSAWLGHIPFAAWLIREINPIIFVELGTHFGHSYFSFCQSVAEARLATKCYAVDTWHGDEHSGQYTDDIFAQVVAHQQEYYAGFSQLLRMTFDEALNSFEENSIELLHIDGLHTYEAVRHDFETWLPKLAPGAVVVLHDTIVREHGFGVWKLWEELQAQYPNNLAFEHSSGLGVLQLGDAPQGKRLEWLQPNSLEKKQLLNYFTAIGSRLELHAHLNQSIADRDTQIDALQTEIIRIKNTPSWRITKPLRFIRRTLIRAIQGITKL